MMCLTFYYVFVLLSFFSFVNDFSKFVDYNNTL